MPIRRRELRHRPFGAGAQSCALRDCAEPRARASRPDYREAPSSATRPRRGGADGSACFWRGASGDASPAPYRGSVRIADKSEVGSASRWPLLMASKHDLTRELDLPLGARLRLEGGAGKRCERTAGGALVRQREIWVIDEVEELRTELERDALRDAKRAVQAEIVIAQTIAADDVSPGIAECVDGVDEPRWFVARLAGSLCSVRKERAGIEPAVGGAASDVAGPRAVGPVRTAPGIAVIPARRN